MKILKRDRSFLLLLTTFTLLFFLTSAAVLIKFGTGFAAEFTDSVLRPILGNTTVGFMEKVYFNSADKIQQLTNSKGSVPQFANSGGEIKEGLWHNRPLPQFPGQNVMAETFVRPDPSRPFAYVTLAQIDMSAMSLGVVAGTSQPGGPIGNFGPGKIPADILNSGNLVAAFDGGFQYRDGEYGMIVDGRTYVPLKQDVGTLVGYKSGGLRIINYTGQDLGTNVDFVRQNCPLLVENGQVFAANETNKKLWGRTFNSDIYTWRSGIGLTQNGNLIYAVGNNLSPETLAIALKDAGAINAIQLDINPFWVRFNIFKPNGFGGYATSTLTKDLKDGSKAYLTSYSKDFFYLYKRQS